MLIVFVLALKPNCCVPADLETCEHLHSFFFFNE